MSLRTLGEQLELKSEGSENTPFVVRDAIQPIIDKLKRARRAEFVHALSKEGQLEGESESE